MAIINKNFNNLQPSYLFSLVAEEVKDYKAENPGSEVISLGIGDVSQPLAPSVREAMHHAIDEYAKSSTFHGYGPEQGYMFLREAIAENDYHKRGIAVDTDEIFVNDGAKSDLANISDLFSSDIKVGVTDPVYPVYVDSNIIAGRGNNIVYLPCNENNGFVPLIPDKHLDLIYLCYPNNPTGTVLTHEELAKWVEYAIYTGAIILYDSAYEAYVSTPKVPRSIYEIKGARRVAIEFRSFSKTAGFTGVRCGYTVIPKELCAPDANDRYYQLNRLWKRRQSTKFNGASYISQCGAAAIYTPAGKRYTSKIIKLYKQNAQILREGCEAGGLRVFGGVDAPYLWVKTPEDMRSWEFFHFLLHNIQLVCTPGSGFGSCGEGYVRLTAFNTPQSTQEAARRLAGLNF